MDDLTGNKNSDALEIAKGNEVFLEGSKNTLKL